MDYILTETKDVSALVVDDNPVNLLMASNMIGAAKIETDTASSGLEAIEKIKSKNYDLVFLDYIMPEVDGLETTRMLREMGYTEEKLCIIALSGSNDESSVKMYKESGMQDSLPKPIIPEELDKILKKWLPPEKLLINKHENKLDALKKIKGINPPAGIEDSRGDFSAYRSFLELFVRNTPNIAKALPSKLNNEKKFAAAVRNALKICLNAGAFDLAEKARTLEQAASDGDMKFCLEKLQPFLSGINDLREDLLAVISDN